MNTKNGGESEIRRLLIFPLGKGKEKTKSELLAEQAKKKKLMKQKNFIAPKTERKGKHYVTKFSNAA